MTTLAERIKAARQYAKLSQSKLAEQISIAQTAISQLESGKTLKSSYLPDIAFVCRVNPEWLVWGKGEMLGPTLAIGKNNEGIISADEEGARIFPISTWDDETPLDDDEVYVPFLKEVELSAGLGRTAVEVSATQKLRFGKRSLRNHNVQFDNAVCGVVSGNSMEPVLPDGSTVGINRGQTTIVDGKMYALEHDGQLRVKVLYRMPGGGLRMRSFNQAEHPDEIYTPEEMEEKSIKVLGRVFWAASFY
ncbi:MULTISPECIES: XRE family transcriptional regulator [Bacteria]|uniref:XRE family transcriptional regulator n=1 Tax=Bacteria TaxID=2 RepID=UPI0039F47E22